MNLPLNVKGKASLQDDTNGFIKKRYDILGP